MARAVAKLAEVIRRAHQPHAKMPLPHAVHQHARSQRMFHVRQPSRQLQPPARICRHLDSPTENRRHPPWRQLPQPLAVARHVHFQVRNFAFLCHHRHHRRGHRFLFYRFRLHRQLGQLRLEFVRIKSLHTFARRQWPLLRIAEQFFDRFAFEFSELQHRCCVRRCAVGQFV